MRADTYAPVFVLPFCDWCGHPWAAHRSPNGCQYRHMEPRALNTLPTKLCKRAGLPHLGPHALRHTVATMAGYALGVDWKQLQAMLGHTMLSTTMDIYVDMIEDVNRDAASKIDGWFE